MPYVFSTMTAAVSYNEMLLNDKGAHKILRSVTIKGGSGVANKNLVTPLGVGTQVSEDDLKLLKNDAVFKEHLKKGFVSISETDENPEVMAASMTTRDASSPLTPNDFKETDEAKPVEDKKGLLSRFKR